MTFLNGTQTVRRTSPLEWKGEGAKLSTLYTAFVLEGKEKTACNLSILTRKAFRSDPRVLIVKFLDFSDLRSTELGKN